jgi:hypothetical protein
LARVVRKLGVEMVSVQREALTLKKREHGLDMPTIYI